ncbi:MAG TPA: dihydrofolate reductase family protein [Chthoniobacterales bacterium]
MPRPRVLTNFAITADGKISTRNHTPARFTSPNDKQRLLEIRALADAILVGRGTVETDAMSMTIPDVKLQKKRIAEGKPSHPIRVIVSNSGKIPATLKLFANRDSPILIYATEHMPGETREALSGLATLNIAKSDGVDLGGLLADLHDQHGVRTVVCEGGATLFRSLAELDVIDEMFLTIAPFIFGGAGAPTLTGVPGIYLPKSRGFDLKSMQVKGGECFAHFVRKRENILASPA